MLRLAGRKELKIKPLAINKVPKRGRKDPARHIGQEHQSPHPQAIASVRDALYLVDSGNKTGGEFHGVFLFRLSMGLKSYHFRRRDHADTLRLSPGGGLYSYL